jgi:TonB family protein
LAAAALMQAQEPPTSNRASPHVLSKTEPEYTEEARRARVNAVVTLKIIVRADGTVGDVVVARGAGFGLDENAIECVRTWQFAPGMKDGKAVPVPATIDVNFRIARRDNEGQHASLNFTLAAGSGRPQLVKGAIPPNPSSAPSQRFRISLTVDSNGVPENLAVIDATDPKWADRALRDLKGWRFVPASANGQAVAAQGIFELTAGGLR